MKVVIAGAGKIGNAVAAALSNEGHDITVIDRLPDVISSISNTLDVICVEGNASSPDTLREAGVEGADLVVAATESDEANMVCGVASYKLGAKCVIARIRDPQYLNSREFFRSALGITHVLNPEYECAAEISRILRFPAADQVETFADGHVELAECRITADSPLKGLALKELPSKYKAKVLISIAQRDGNVLIPNGDFIIQEGDKLSIAGAPAEMRKFSIAVGLYRRPIKNAVLMGGSRIAVYLADSMIRNGVAVKIIERDSSRCDELCDLVPGASVICGDATRSEVLLEEGITDADAFIALSGEDGYNVIASMFANNCKVPKIITKINRPHMSDILVASGLETVVSGTDPVVQQIVRYARAMGDSIGSSMERLYRLADGKAEALGFLVKDGAACIGIPLRSLKLKKDILICAITRNGKTIIPGGNDSIQSGDLVLVVTTAGRLTELDAIIES